MIFILSMFGRCFFILAGFITLDYFTPLHIVLILIIGEISFLFNDDNNWKLYLKIFFFIKIIEILFKLNNSFTKEIIYIFPQPY